MIGSAYRSIKTEVQAMLEEDDKRLSKFNGKHDQFTGEGMEGHTWCLSLPDFYIKRQWLTKEFENNEFFKKLAECGSISAK